MILVAAIRDATFFGPSGIQITVHQAFAILFPPFRQRPFFDRFVFVAPVALSGHLHKRGIRDLSLADDEASGPEAAARNF